MFRQPTELPSFGEFPGPVPRATAVRVPHTYDIPDSALLASPSFGTPAQRKRTERTEDQSRTSNLTSLHTINLD